jgi:transposase
MQGLMAQVTPQITAKIMAYRAMNYNQQEITEKVPVSYSTVNRTLNEIEIEAKKSDEPLEVFGENMENLLDVTVEVQE